MSSVKRVSQEPARGQGSKKRRSGAASNNQNTHDSDQQDSDLEHEDAFGDIYEDEVIVDGDQEMGDEADDQVKPRVWRHGIDTLEEGEQLDYDPTTYTVYETANMEWPSLSFDIIPNSTYSGYHTKYPVVLHIVSGTQTEPGCPNMLNIIKMENICQTKELDEDDNMVNLDENADSDDDNDDDLKDQTPIIQSRSFVHPGCVNRVRVMPQNPSIVATFSEDGNVYIWDISKHVKFLDRVDSIPPPTAMQPLYTFHHGAEGYGLAWSAVSPGFLASGDNNGCIYIHEIKPDGTAARTINTGKPFSIPDTVNNMIEAIQWSPKDPWVIATADTNGLVAIWSVTDTTCKPRITLKASNTDINVLSWNTKTQYLLATGDDDGIIKIWDLRLIGQGPDAAVQGQYAWHKKAITSLEWHPHESSMFIASSEDNGISVWDLALEADIDEVAKEATGADMLDYDIPGQLLFMHLGQTQPKELHFHPQIPSLILSTATEGIDIFKPANMDVVVPAVSGMEPSEHIAVD